MPKKQSIQRRESMRAQIQKEYILLKSEIIKQIKELVSFRSVLDNSPSNEATSHPFGIEIDRCLDYTLSLCKELGFNIYKDPKGYYGYAEIGEGSEMLGILGHLDIVPVSDPENWSYDPFTLTQEGDKLIARGVSDDKGPIITTLYAVVALKNLGIKFNKRVRFIFGTDEETFWRCINRYVEQEELPTLGFTPDSNFPVIYAEKGLLQVNFTGKGENITIKGGEAYNSVPTHIDYFGDKQQALIESLKNHNFEYSIIEDGVRVIGKTSHAQSTELGINPISRLAICLTEIGIQSPTLEFITKYINTSPYGEHIFGIKEDEPSGKLKFNLAKIDINKEFSFLGMDTRIPVTHSMEDIIQTLQQLAKDNNFEYEQHDRLNSLYVPKDHSLVQTLCDIYKEETDFDPTPIATGGATYSRAMKNVVTFGMIFPDTPKTAHLTNEYINVQDIDRAFIIYAKAILKLATE